MLWSVTVITAVHLDSSAVENAFSRMPGCGGAGNDRGYHHSAYLCCLLTFDFSLLVVNIVRFTSQYHLVAFFFCGQMSESTSQDQSKPDQVPVLCLFLAIYERV